MFGAAEALSKASFARRSFKLAPRAIEHVYYTSRFNTGVLLIPTSSALDRYVLQLVRASIFPRICPQWGLLAPSLAFVRWSV